MLLQNHSFPTLLSKEAEQTIYGREPNRNEGTVYSEDKIDKHLVSLKKLGVLLRQ